LNLYIIKNTCELLENQLGLSFSEEFFIKLMEKAMDSYEPRDLKSYDINK